MAVCLALCRALFIIFPLLPQETYYHPKTQMKTEALRAERASPGNGQGPSQVPGRVILGTPALWSQQGRLAGPWPWPRELMQRPKLCSEQSLFKQSLTGNLAPLTHSDSTLLRKKESGAGASAG